MEQINLNIIPDGAMPVCHASQFDKNRTIRFNLKDNGSVYTLTGTETITCKVRKPDDTENTINVANTSSSYVDVTFGLGDTDLSGYTMCELKIVKGTQTIGSRNFLLNIEADAFDGSKLEERSASGAIASFETNYIDNLNELIVNITATQAGSGTPSPSNPRAISGWSSCDITKTGANLYGGMSFANDILNQVTGATIDTTNKTISYTASNINNKKFFKHFKPNTQYTFFLSMASGRTNLSINYTDGTVESLDDNAQVSAEGKSIDSLSGQWQTGTSILYYEQFGIIEGVKQASDFEPYNGTTYPISLGDTYYGGTLNVTTGELTVTHGIVDLGSLSYTSHIYGGVQGFYSMGLQQLAAPFANSLCSIYKRAISDSDFNNNHTDFEFYINEGSLLKIKNSNYTDAPTFKTAMSGVQLVYELATPTTVQLTPTEVRTLLEDNNIFADTGDVVSCKYLVEVT